MKARKLVWAAVSKALAVTTVTLIMALILAPGAWAAGKYKILYNFSGGSDGGYLDAGLIFDSSGNLYGTAYIGGAYGNGVVFELTPNSDGNWTETVIYSFTGGADGGNPSASLIFDAVGNLYSTANLGGAYGYGTVFMLSPNSGGTWTETVLYSFAGGTDGAFPIAGLIFDAAGNLYGTTNKGGKGNCPDYTYRGCGTVFELTPNSGGGWAESALYAFAGGKDGGYPDHANLVFDGAGNLYGATRDHGLSGPRCAGYGCGTVFELTPNSGGWTETVLHRFNQKDGGNPDGTLIFDAAGNLYGTTLDGGPHDAGNVFKLTLGQKGKWTEQVIHEFTGKDGAGSYAGVIFDAAGNLYGAASSGGTHGDGTVYKLTPTSGGKWKISVLHQFRGGTDGWAPRGDVVFDANGDLYDTTADNGTTGTVFEIMP